MSGIRKTLKLVNLLTVKCQKCNANISVKGEVYFEGENEDGSLYWLCAGCSGDIIQCDGCGEDLHIDNAREMSGSYFHEECYMAAGQEVREI